MSNNRANPRVDRLRTESHSNARKERSDEAIAKAASGSKKLVYKVRNWREYNESLVRRGDVTFWFSDAVVDAWEHENGEKENGRPFKYSDRTIETLLAIRELFRLPYR